MDDGFADSETDGNVADAFAFIHQPSPGDYFLLRRHGLGCVADVSSLT
jgi:hypothetical protein